MTDTNIATESAAAAVETVAAAPAFKAKNINEVQTWVLEAIAKQNDITVVSAEVVEVKFDGKRGKRLELVLTGAGVGDATRRYFLRENSAFASGLIEAGITSHYPKKDRGSNNYMTHFGINEGAVTFEAPAPAKPEKVLLSEDEKKARRAAGKAAAKAAREAAKAEAEANAPVEPATIDESASDVNAETTILESAEPVVISADTDSDQSTEVNAEEQVLEPA